ncbi:valacyclovir hydrolase-like protein [Leptotrombidium deliense]|uniref:Valacyclovir hydrolase-like protein n=1 Tax=Leptotrombidium deliense TaxID=299467 RepID=A0A443S528_9ACAR|nr:valacyclovir hydrolase-like protein [Leptotrombidium deliense]
MTAQVNIAGVNIHYEKVGTGKKVVALLPGALGTARSDFSHQLDGLNKDKFTLISWDPPGYGASRPPNRDFHDFYRKDASTFARMMDTLGYKKYSVIGWSDGGITGLILAANYRENVERLVALAANSYFSEEDKAMVTAVRDTEKWNPKFRQVFENIYGPELFKQMWADIVDYWVKSSDICSDDLSKIVCPTLIIQGDKDPLVAKEHPAFLASKIKNSRVHMFVGGKHNVHQKFAKEFNELVEKFILE